MIYNDGKASWTINGPQRHRQSTKPASSKIGIVRSNLKTDNRKQLAFKYHPLHVISGVLSE